MQEKIKLPSNRNFGLVFFTVFLLIALWPILNNNDLRIWSLIVSLVFLVFGSLNSKLLTPLNKLWFKFGIFLGNIIAPIIMGIVFFLVVTPTGLIMKILKKDLLKLKNNNSDTYWLEKDNSNNSLRNQF